MSAQTAAVALAVSPTVSVVVPCRNEESFLDPLLHAILTQDLPPHEIIVVDNGSTDASVARVQAYAATHRSTPIRVLECRDEGAAAAMNVGVRAATGDVIVRLDGHSRPRPDYIRRCVERLSEDGAGVVGGVWDIVPGARTLRARAIACAVGSKLGSGGADYRDSRVDQAPRDVDTVPFGCYRRELWRTLNGYDPSLLVVEDGEFNFRVRQAGYRVILDPEIRTEYFPRRRFRTLARQYLRYGWWKIPMLLRHPRAIRVRQMIPLGFVTVMLVLAFASAASEAAKMLLAVLGATYGAAILIAALWVARGARDLRLWLPIALAYAVIHFSWGIGGLLHLVTLGRWPPWRVHPQGPRV